MLQIIGLFLFTLVFSMQAFALRCAELFENPQFNPSIKRVQIVSDRVKVSELAEVSGPSKLLLVERNLSQNTDRSTMDLLSMLVHTTSYLLNEKNVLHKNELTLGLKLENGYSVHLKYVSDGRENVKFNISSIELVTPSGVTAKVAKNMISNTQLKLEKSDFELPAEFFPEGQTIEIAVPVSISGKSLEIIDKFVEDLSLFKKSELQVLVETKSLAQFKRNLLMRKVKALFKKYFIAAPFKAISNLGPSIVIASIVGASILNTPKEVPVFPKKTEAEWVNTSINEISAKTISPEAKIQFSMLRLEAEEKVKQNSQNENVPVLGQNSATAPKYQFSDNHMTWVFEQPADSVNAAKTFIVFTEEASDKSPAPLKFLIMEIDPIKYAEVIKLIKTQGKVLN